MPATFQYHRDIITDPLYLDIDGLTYDYKVVYTFIHSAEQQLLLSFPIRIQGVQNPKTKELNIILYKGQVMLNGEIPNTAMEALASLSGKCFYPVQYSLDKAGRVNQVENLHSLQSNWEIIKRKLQLEFEGAVRDIVIQQTEEILSSQQKTANIYNKDLFHQLYFTIIYSDFQIAKSPNLKFLLSIFPGCNPVAFEGNRSLTIIKENQLQIEIKATCSDHCSFQKIVYSEGEPGYTERRPDAIIGALTLLYTLKQPTGIIQSITGTIGIETLHGQTKEYMISITQKEGILVTGEVVGTEIAVTKNTAIKNHFKNNVYE